MSQVKFKTKFQNKDVEVVGGWDRVTYSYHLTIFDTDPKADDEVIWDGLNKFGFSLKFEDVEQALNDLGITAPENFNDLILKREGNIIHTWNGSSWNMSSM